jgi:hypothetical protein
MADEKDLPEELQAENIKDAARNLDVDEEKHRREIDLINQRNAAFKETLGVIAQVKSAEVDLFIKRLGPDRMAAYRQAQQEIVQAEETLDAIEKEKIAYLESWALRKAANRELSDAEKKEHKDKMKAFETTTKVAKEAGSVAVKQARIVREALEGVHDTLEDLENQGHSTVESMLGIDSGMKGMAKTLLSTKGGFKAWTTGIMRALNPLNLFISLVGSVIASTIKVAKEIDEASAAYRKSTGASYAFTKSIEVQADAMKTTGINAGELFKAQESLQRGMADFTKQSTTDQASLRATAAYLQELGISADTTADIANEATKSLGYGFGEVEGVMLQVAGVAEGLKMPFDMVAKDFATVSKKLAFYGKGVMGVFKKLSMQSKSTGLSVDQLLGVVEQFDTFEGAGKAVGKLNSIMGGPYLNSIDMLNASEEKRVEILKQSMKQSGMNFKQMGKYEQKMIASALGVDVAEARKLFGAETEEEKLEALTKTQVQDRAKQAQSTRELMLLAINAMAADVTKYLKDIRDMIQWVTGWVEKGMEKFDDLSTGGKVAVVGGGLAASAGATALGRSAARGAASRVTTSMLGNRLGQGLINMRRSMPKLRMSNLLKGQNPLQMKKPASRAAMERLAKMRRAGVRPGQGPAQPGRMRRAWDATRRGAGRLRRGGRSAWEASRRGAGHLRQGGRSALEMGKRGASRAASRAGSAWKWVRKGKTAVQAANVARTGAAASTALTSTAAAGAAGAGAAGAGGGAAAVLAPAAAIASAAYTGYEIGKGISKLGGDWLNIDKNLAGKGITDIDWGFDAMGETFTYMWDETLKWFHDALVQPWKDVWPEIKGMWNDGLQWVKDRGGDTMKWFHDALVQPWKDVWPEIKGMWNDGLQWVTDKVTGWLHKTFVQPWKDVWPEIKGMWGDITQPFLDAWDSLKTVWSGDRLGEVWDSLKTALMNAAPGLKDWMLSPFTAVWEKVQEIIQKIKDGWEDIKNMPGDTVDYVKDQAAGVADSVAGGVEKIPLVGGIAGGLIRKVGGVDDFVYEGDAAGGTITPIHRGDEFLGMKPGGAAADFLDRLADANPAQHLMKMVGQIGSASGKQEPPTIINKVFVGNEEFKNYVAETTAKTVGGEGKWGRRLSDEISPFRSA